MQQCNRKSEGAYEVKFSNKCLRFESQYIRTMDYGTLSKSLRWMTNAENLALFLKVDIHMIIKS